MKPINITLFLTIFILNINISSHASTESLFDDGKSAHYLNPLGNGYSNESLPANCPTLSVAVTNPTNCGETGSLNFTFTNVPNGSFSISFTGGNFANVVVTNGKAKVNSYPRTYLNLKITVDGCTSADGINATVLEGVLPNPPVINMENLCGESILTASDYTGTLLWSTGETTESITVTKAGDYTISQTVNGCTSDVATETATPLAVPVISVLGTDPLLCSGDGSLDFIFTNVPNAVYNIPYDGGEFKNIVIIENKSSISTTSGDYNNLLITINGCISENGVNVTLSDPPTPAPPDVNVDNQCELSILTASNYTGTLLWSTGETTESITVTEAGEYSVTQTINDCISDAAIANAAPNVTPTLSVVAEDPEHCVLNGKLIFTFTNVPDGSYNIFYDGGSFSEVAITGNSATIEAGSGIYGNLLISVDNCTSESGVNAVINESDKPYPPIISMENNCGESILTATSFTGILLWSTGETTESITVTEAGDYSVRQIVNDCVSEPAIITATPLLKPGLSVIAQNPEHCTILGKLTFNFSAVPDGTYSILYDGGSFSDVTVFESSAMIDVNAGTYNNLQIALEDCTSDTGVNATINESDIPNPPDINFENKCGETVLTASNYTGSLLWSTGESTESIAVTNDGEYTITQTVDGCTSNAASVAITIKKVPVISVNVNNPENCNDVGTLDFNFINVPDGLYTIYFDGGEFTGVNITGGTASLIAEPDVYNNLYIAIDNCISNYVNAEITNPNKPGTPIIIVSDDCGESVLTASDYTGTLLWSTGETTQSIIVSEVGEYSVSQIIDGCTSELATAMATPKDVPTLSVIAINPMGCLETGSLEFTFTNVPDGTYTIFYEGGSFTGVNVNNNKALVTANIGTYNNLVVKVNECSSNNGVNIKVSNQEIIGEKGYKTVFSYTNNNANLRAIPVNFSQKATVLNISIYHNGGTGDAIMAVYNDSNGKPGSLIGITPATKINGISGWQSFQLSNPVTVTSNQIIWLAWLFENNPGIRYTSGVPGRAQSSITWSGGMPAEFGTSSIADVIFSIYCSYSTYTPPPSPNISSEIQCGQTILTATNYTGSLLWSTGETTESIIIKQEGTYSVTQTINGCVSDEAIIQVTPKLIPSFTVAKTNPQICDGNGLLEFTFTNVPDGNYSIYYDQGEFTNVAVNANKAVVEAPAGSYFNLKIIVDGCTSPAGINSVLTAPNAPLPPQISVENNCGESVLTAHDYTGTLLWNTGETTESIIVTEPGNYLVTQTANGCISDATIITAEPKTIPGLSVSVNNPEYCEGDGILDFNFTDVPDGNHTVYFVGGSFVNISVISNKASVKVQPGTYNNLIISVDGCLSENGVNARVNSTEPPPPPTISVENLCGESIITASDYSGSLLWNNAKTTETITINESGDYWVKQTVGGCTSDPAIITATPKSIPIISVSVENPEVCNEQGLLNFEFANVPEGDYNITYTGGTFANVSISASKAQVQALAGTYNNLKISVNECVSVGTLKAVISDPNPPIAPLVNVENNCGESVLTASEFSGSLKWNTGETTPSIIVKEAGEYTVAQSVDGCTSEGASIIAAPKNIPAIPDFSVVNECDNISVLTASNYEPSASLKWSTGATDEIITVNSADTYELIQIIDGCESESVSKSVEPKPSPTLDAVVINPENCGELGTINFSFSNVPDGFYTISYDGGSFENVGITGQSASVQAENGSYNNLSIAIDECNSTDQINVSVSAPNSIALPKVTVENKCGESVLTVIESLENASLLWSTNETSNSITVFNTGNYSVSQSLNGCRSSAAIVSATPLSIPEKPGIELQGECNEAIVFVNNLETDAWLYWQHNGITDSTKNDIINFSETGIYRLYQMVDECISEDTLVTINSFSEPQPPVSLGNKVVCETDPMPRLFAEAAPPDGYKVVWYTQPSGGSALESPSLENIGSVTYYAESQNSTGNCVSASRTPVTLTIKQSPVSIINEENIIGKPYSHVAVLIFPEESYKYQWYLNNNEIAGAESQYYYISSSDRKDGNVFSVKVELDNGCSSLFAYAYPSNLSSGIITNADNTKSAEIPGSLVVYPNPANNKVFVALDDFKMEENQKLTVKIFSINGACVINTPMDNIPKSINVESLRPGVYSVVLYRNTDLVGIKNLIIRK